MPCALRKRNYTEHAHQERGCIKASRQIRPSYFGFGHPLIYDITMVCNCSKTFCVLLIITVTSLTIVAALEEPKRSARWDDYIDSFKRAAADRDSKRASRIAREVTAPENTPCGWKYDEALCRGVDFNAADTLRRRDGGLLATPQSQGYCGSCWAFATVNALTDQLSISSSRKQPLLSSRYLTTCTKDDNLVGSGNGCCGARVLEAGIEFIKDNGIVTDSCSMYGNLSYFAQWIKAFIELPTCPSVCDDGSLVSPSTYSLSDYVVLESDEEIMEALDNNSVVIAGMVISDEFICAYQCGIYCESNISRASREKQSQQFRHAVLIVDYGTQSGIDFWVIKNSWGDGIHENGYFRIRRGELDIGRNGDAIKLLIGRAGMPVNTPTSPRSVPIRTCYANTVSDPEDYVSIMSAVDFILEEVVNEGIASPCADGTTVSQLTLDSITSSSLQLVAGIDLDISLIASTPCREGDKAVKARINSNVFIYLNGSLVLRNGTEYETFFVSVGGSKTLSSNSMLAAILSILLVIATCMYT